MLHTNNLVGAAGQSWMGAQRSQNPEVMGFQKELIRQTGGNIEKLSEMLLTEGRRI